MSRPPVDHVPNRLTRFNQAAARAAILTHVANVVISDDHAAAPSQIVKKLPGDRRALRGIPVTGVPGGLPGTIRGSRPDAITDDRSMTSGQR